MDFPLSFMDWTIADLSTLKIRPSYIFKWSFTSLLVLSLIRVAPMPLLAKKAAYLLMYGIAFFVLLSAVFINIKLSKRILITASIFLAFHTFSFIYGCTYLSMSVCLSWYIQGLLWIGMLFAAYKALSCHFSLTDLRFLLCIALGLACIQIFLGFLLYDISLQKVLSPVWLSKYSRLFVGRTTHYGFEKVGLTYFLSSCYFLTLPFQSRYEKFTLGAFVVSYTYLVGSKTSLLGFFAVFLLMFITRFKGIKTRRAMSYLVLLGCIVVVCTVWPMLNRYMISHGRYLGPVFGSSSYYSHPVGFGAGSYTEVAKKGMLDIELEKEDVGLLSRKVQTGKYDGDPYGLFPAAESNLLWFGISYGWIFLAIVIGSILKTVKNGIEFWPMVPKAKQAAIMTIVYMVASGLVQDYIWIHSSWVIIALCIAVILNTKLYSTISC